MKISDFFSSPVRKDDVKQELIAEIRNPEVVNVDVNRVFPNPFQPRKVFSEESLAELSSSIVEFGVIQPILVRQSEKGFEIIAGERRYRASLLAKCKDIPCIVRQVNDQEMAEIALLENLQREDLHFFEEAAGYETLLSQFSITQEELARRIGKDQSTVANKLRLLRLPCLIRELLTEARLSERHARALLKLDSDDTRYSVLQAVIENRFNVKDTELYIEALMKKEAAEPDPKKRPNVLRVVKDVRIFINTIGELVGQMKKVGLDVRVNQDQDDDFVTITMIVPKRR